MNLLRLLPRLAASKVAKLLRRLLCCFGVHRYVDMDIGSLEYVKVLAPVCERCGHCGIKEFNETD